MNDSERPPVLAHQRFLEDRKSFADVDRAQRFRRIHAISLWRAASSVSGVGSEMDETAALRAELPRLLARLGITSLVREHGRTLGIIHGRRARSRGPCP